MADPVTITTILTPVTLAKGKQQLKVRPKKERKSVNRNRR